MWILPKCSGFMNNIISLKTVTTVVIPHALSMHGQAQGVARKAAFP